MLFWLSESGKVSSFFNCYCCSLIRILLSDKDCGTVVRVSGYYGIRSDHLLLIVSESFCFSVFCRFLSPLRPVYTNQKQQERIKKCFPHQPKHLNYIIVVVALFKFKICLFDSIFKNKKHVTEVLKNTPYLNCKYVRVWEEEEICQLRQQNNKHK